ncbi:fibrillin-2 [Lingula anatina]|uniref:Fibrillin-2 n=1 Tax=Lingula anatina TaxID=7574 RepID=A0A1S3H2X9_LINAN|nr:fibrillin-2 [Lingula anatina]|eukprot:XP_013380302.1 fibrillin-2 [Lingula anatina]
MSYVIALLLGCWALVGTLDAAMTQQCIRGGQLCWSNARCCSKYCHRETYGVYRCVHGNGCAADGEKCSWNSHCCSGYCHRVRYGVYRCAAPEAGEDRCFTVDSPCTFDVQCCSRFCYKHPGRFTYKCL